MVVSSQDKLSLREKWGMIGGIVCVIVTCAGIVAVITLFGILGQLQGCKEESKQYTVERIKQHFKLQGHIEGGFFYENYRSTDTIRVYRSQSGSYVNRTMSTAIYFLLEQGTKSTLHRLQSDEIWHHYMGGPVKLFFIYKDGSYEEKNLWYGHKNNESPAVLAPSHSWFGAILADDSNFALIGATVAPGFEYEDFEMANRTELLKSYPQHSDIITQLT